MVLFDKIGQFLLYLRDVLLPKKISKSGVLLWLGNVRQRKIRQILPILLLISQLIPFSLQILPKQLQRRLVNGLCLTHTGVYAKNTKIDLKLELQLRAGCIGVAKHFGTVFKEILSLTFLEIFY